jgi:class 3 adenylate cyclase
MFGVQACHSHAGYVLDQEGDSWCIAFHDALDAVAFSLQVRVAAASLAATAKVLFCWWCIEAIVHE